MRRFDEYPELTEDMLATLRGAFPLIRFSSTKDGLFRIEARCCYRFFLPSDKKLDIRKRRQRKGSWTGRSTPPRPSRTFVTLEDAVNAARKHSCTDFKRADDVWRLIQEARDFYGFTREQIKKEPWWGDGFPEDLDGEVKQ